MFDNLPETNPYKNKKKPRAIALAAGIHVVISFGNHRGPDGDAGETGRIPASDDFQVVSAAGFWVECSGAPALRHLFRRQLRLSASAAT